MIEEIEILRPDDFHVHLRQGEMLEAVLPATANVFGRALAMPNLNPSPVVDAEDVVRYRNQIFQALERIEYANCHFHPLMAIKLTPATTLETIGEAHQAGVVAAKLYPDRPPGDAGTEVTTNSGGGIYDFDPKGPLKKVLGAMEDLGMVLCVHAEDPDEEVMVREAKFASNQVVAWATAFPRLKIVIEHASCATSIRIARDYRNVAASITAHHLVLTLDDVIGGRLDPHSFCMPVAKTRSDRSELIKAATSGNPSYFFGSDSAPHLVRHKQSASAPAGCFTAPVALPILAGVFEDAGALDRLEAFVSRAGAEFYGLPLNEGAVRLKRGEFSSGSTPKWFCEFPTEGPRTFWHDRRFRWEVLPH